MLGRDDPEEERERPGVMKGDRAQVARDHSEEKACELGPEERRGPGDPAPDGQGLGGGRVPPQDEAAEEREDRQRKEENRSPPRADGSWRSVLRATTWTRCTAVVTRRPKLEKA